MAEYKLLDTSKFDDFISKKNDYLDEYDEIKKNFEEVVNDLCSDWKGYGADAFKEDVKSVSTNITGVGDILQTICDMLIDCRDVFSECDTALGGVNRDASNK